MAADSIVITPGARRGCAQVPWSKSHLHRLMIGDFLSGTRDAWNDVAPSADVAATRRCLSALEMHGQAPVLDCGESGSTLRFLIPVAMALCSEAVFVAGGRLPQRPLAPLLKVLRGHGVEATAGFPLGLKGRLTPGSFRLAGDISSQFITGLLFALPLLDGDSVIQLTTPLESSGYVDMTLDVLNAYGIHVMVTADGYMVPGGQCYRRPQHVVPELDWSGAAFWFGLNALGGGSQVRVETTDGNGRGLRADSRQPDCAIQTLLGDIGGVINVSQCPDLFPVLAVVAGASAGTTTFIGVNRLRLKESDRLTAMSEVLMHFGIGTECSENAFSVHGVGPHFRGNTAIATFGDHRIAMAAGIGGTIADAPVTLDRPDCVCKSYPAFWIQLEALRLQQ